MRRATTTPRTGKGRNASRPAPLVRRREKRGDDSTCVDGPRSKLLLDGALWATESHTRPGPTSGSRSKLLLDGALWGQLRAARDACSPAARSKLLLDGALWAGPAACRRRAPRRPAANSYWMERCGSRCAGAYCRAARLAWIAAVTRSRPTRSLAAMAATVPACTRVPMPLRMRRSVQGLMPTSTHHSVMRPASITSRSRSSTVSTAGGRAMPRHPSGLRQKKLRRPLARRQFVANLGDVVKRPDHPPTSHGGRVAGAEPSPETQPMNETTLPAAETARFARLQFLRSLKPLDVAVQDVHYLGGIATVDGVRASFRLDVSRYESAADYAGMTAPQAFAFADLSMTDRAAWDEAHPGVEPLPDAMLAALENAAEEVGELAQDALESDGEPAGGWED